MVMLTGVYKSEQIEIVVGEKAMTYPWRDDLTVVDQDAIRCHSREPTTDRGSDSAKGSIHGL